MTTYQVTVPEARHNKALADETSQRAYWIIEDYESGRVLRNKKGGPRKFYSFRGAMKHLARMV